jgi:hypothetical protein
MNVEQEIKAAEAAVEGAITEVKSEVVGEVAKVEGEAKTVAKAVVTEAKKIEGEVVKEVEKVVEKVKAAFVQIISDEKLYLREAELEFLKAQMEIQRLNRIAEAKSKAYTDYIEQLFVKYGLSKAEYIFDGAVNQFKKIEKAL